MASAITEACKGVDQELALMTLTVLKCYSEDYQKSTVKKVKEGQDFDLHVPLSKYLLYAKKISNTRVIDYDGSILGFSQEAGSSGNQLQTESSSSVEENKDNEANKKDARRASLPAVSSGEYKDSTKGARSAQLSEDKGQSVRESKDSTKGARSAQLPEDKGQSVRESKDSKSKPKVSNGPYHGNLRGPRNSKVGLASH